MNRPAGRPLFSLLHRVPPFPAISGYRKAPKKERKGRTANEIKARNNAAMASAVCGHLLLGLVICPAKQVNSVNTPEGKVSLQINQSCQQPFQAFRSHPIHHPIPAAVPYQYRRPYFIDCLKRGGKHRSGFHPLSLSPFSPVCFCNRIKAF